MKIGALARETGLSPSRIRYYEAIGLVAGAERARNGYRTYSSDTVQVLRIIIAAQQAGFSLEDIRALVPRADSGGWDHPRLVAGLKRKLMDIEAMQANLAGVHGELASLVERLETGLQDGDCVANARRLLDGIST